MLISEKEYVALQLYWDTEGVVYDGGVLEGGVYPEILYREGGGVYVVDTPDIRPPELKAARQGGFGCRYRLRATCEDENVWGHEYFLYLELFGRVGRWRCGEDYVGVDVIWDVDGTIKPLAIYPPGAPVYRITRQVQEYPMSARKTDGSGRRYVVEACCAEDASRRRVFHLMLEHGGPFIGRWFCENAVDAAPPPPG